MLLQAENPAPVFAFFEGKVVIPKVFGIEL